MPSAPTPPSNCSPSFFQTELECALSEQAFGIVGYFLKSATAHDATASVELLEGVQLDITLTVRGFRVTRSPTQNVVGDVVDFETIEVLLQRYSPLYEAKRMELLFTRLGP
ncbi:uncharacterized protein FOMMEDRAFT_137409 [Fomitiporia mediterranea MF3/22]|uniref:uncharacterized protein n=1 Tax=Fomitiporia mediterranea (strain MF3/22) TaxID=694068 RepID=UPI0004409100|nr:uncharacterized protein FOMMEDRAFT_137409 [Fomitiporia mediterranea MF3/22]EJC98086.1 hypothetical protein FOMMEDRAFT_137409 [Fomitiporia mediterranea MF3/22]